MARTKINNSQISISADLVPASANGAALGSATYEWSDLYMADGAIMYFGADQEITLTHQHNNGLLLNSSKYLAFGDTGTYIAQSADAALLVSSDGTITLDAATDIVIDAAGRNITFKDAGTTRLDFVMAASGQVTMDMGADLVIDVDGGFIYMKDGGVSGLEIDMRTAGSGNIKTYAGDGDDDWIFYASAGSTEIFRIDDSADSLLMASTKKIEFNDATQFIHGESGADLTLGATTDINLDCTTVDVNAALDVSGAATLASLVCTAGATFGGGTGASGVTVTTGGAITADGIIKTEATTAATSTTDGSIQTDGGLSVALDAVVGDDLILLSDAAVIHMGADKELTLTHVHNTGSVLQVTTEMTASVAPILTLDAQCSGTPAVGTGVGIVFKGETAVGNTETYASIEAVTTAVGDGAEDADLVFKATTAGTAGNECFRVDGSGGPALLMAGSNQIRLRDDALLVYSSTNGQLDVDADVEVEITAPTVQIAASTLFDVNGAADFSTTVAIGGVLSPASHVDMPDDAHIKVGTGDDMLIYHDGSNSYITNAVGALKVATETSGIAVTIGHTTSETTVADNLTVTGDLTVNGLTTTVNSTTIAITSSFAFEGSTANNYETVLKALNPTADATVYLPALATGSYHLPVLADAASAGSAAVTAAEFALLDGGSTVGTTAVANGDGIFTNDGGVMRHTTVQTFQTYFDANSVGGTSIVSVGTIGTGTWQGTAVASAYLDADTAHLTTTQTFSGAKTFTADITAGVDGTGVDVKFFGDTAGAYGLWDQSADKFIVRGPVGTGTATPGVMRLETAELTVVDGDQLGRIEFIAPLEGSGTDAITVGASIWAEADDTFAADLNDTDLIFATGKSAAATEKMRLNSDGDLAISGDLTISGGNITNAITCDSTLGVSAALTAASLVCTAAATFGGGYGATGATISTAGVGTFNGALTTDGVLTCGGVTIGSAAITEAELEILDGAAVTTAELNLMDGDTVQATVTLVAGDGVVIDDASTMKQCLVSDFGTFLGGAGLTVSSGVLTVDWVSQTFMAHSSAEIQASGSETATGLVNAMTASLSETPLADSVQVYLNGMLQRKSGSYSTNDYYIPGESATTVIMTSVIDSDDVLIVQYIADA